MLNIYSHANVRLVRYFVSYDGLVNVNSFQQSAATTYNGYQYAGW